MSKFFFKQLLIWQKDLTILIIFTLILFFCLLGGLISFPLATKNISIFQIASFPNGLALYQTGNSSHYYTFCPFNDFIIDKNGSRRNVFNPKTINQSTTLGLSQLPSLLNQLTITTLAYFKIPNIKFYYQDDNQKIEFQSLVDGNHIIIQRDIKLNPEPPIRAYGSTMTISEFDFVFDPINNFFYSQQQPEEIKLLNRIYNLNLQSGYKNIDYSLPIRINSGSLVIHNPFMPGFLVVKAQKNQTLWYNPSHKLIEITENIETIKTDSYTTIMEIYIFEDSNKINEII